MANSDSIFKTIIDPVTKEISLTLLHFTLQSEATSITFLSYQIISVSIIDNFPVMLFNDIKQKVIEILDRFLTSGVCLMARVRDSPR